MYTTVTRYGIYIIMFIVQSHDISLFYTNKVSIADTVLIEDPLTSEQVDAVLNILTSISGNFEVLFHCFSLLVSFLLGLEH